MSSEDDDIRLSSCVAPTETDGIAATGTILRAPASAGRETIGEAPVAVAAARGTPLRIASSEGTVVGLIIGFWIFIPREKSFFFPILRSLLQYNAENELHDIYPWVNYIL